MSDENPEENEQTERDENNEEQTNDPRNEEVVGDEDQGERTIRWRDEWGAKPPVSDLKIMSKPILNVILTFTGTPPCEGQDECDNVVRELQDKYQQKVGLPDFPFSFLVTKDGLIYEGRGWDYKPFVPLRAFHKMRGTRLVIAQINTEFDKTLLPAADAAIWDLIQYGVDNEYIHPRAEKTISTPWF